MPEQIRISQASEHNLKDISLGIDHNAITVVTGVSGSGKSSLVFGTIFAECQRRFFGTLSHYSRQFLKIAARPRVRRVDGISPAIAVDQNFQDDSSTRATVASATDAGELLGVLFARYGVAHCPIHGKPTQGASLDKLVTQTLAEQGDHTVHICAPLEQQRRRKLSSLFDKYLRLGFSKALVDGGLHDLGSEADDDETPHDIAIVVDTLAVKPEAEARIRRSLETALDLGDGRVALYQKGDDQPRSILSIRHGCPDCGFSWPELDSRYFGRNSLGRCTHCQGFGFLEEQPCDQCRQTGIRSDVAWIMVAGRSIHDLLLQPVQELYHWSQEQQLGTHLSRGRDTILQALATICKQLDEIGLGYLPLSRLRQHLATGENQRLRISGLLAEGLTGILYLLDEPSYGLHHREIERLWQTLHRLRDRGNTLIVIDHHELSLRNADKIIDLGPGGGKQGGQVLAHFAPREAEQHTATSSTARWLLHPPPMVSIQPYLAPKLSILDISFRDLEIASLSLASPGLNIISGISGSGKTTLLKEVLFPTLSQGATHCRELRGAEGLLRSSYLDRSKGRSSASSTPATMLGIFNEIRQSFAKLPLAQIMGYSSSDFSLVTGRGRCEECRGRGFLTISMRFLSDSLVVCPQCDGKRFNPGLLEVRFNQLSISDLLDLSLMEALERLSSTKIRKVLKSAVDLGLGYLPLGQPLMSVSGGELQRLKLAAALNRSPKGLTLMLDEPSSGLHFDDVLRFTEKLKQLVQQGATIILADNNAILKSAADWLVELGPGPGSLGGRIVQQGKPTRTP